MKKKKKNHKVAPTPMSQLCIFVTVLGMSLFTFVLEWLVFDSVAEMSLYSSSSAAHAQQQPQKPDNGGNVRLVDLLRESLGIDEWLNDDNKNNDTDTDTDATTSAEPMEESSEQADDSTDVQHWADLPDLKLIDDVEIMVEHVNHWSAADLARWLALCGVCNDTLDRVSVYLSDIDNHSPQTFMSLTHAQLELALRRESDDDTADAAAVAPLLARDVRTIALGNSMLRHAAMMRLIATNCASLLGSFGDESAASVSALALLLGEHSDVDLAQTFVATLRFFMRVLVVAIKVLIALAVLIFFGPEGIGLAVLRLLLRAFVALMTIVTPAITLIFPRFRFRVQMPE